MFLSHSIVSDSLQPHVLQHIRLPWSSLSQEFAHTLVHWDSLIAQLVKNPPAMQETPVQFLGQEDPLEKG